MTCATIVDYQVGNLFSVVAAVRKVGFEPQLSSDPQALLRAERLILPGVGAFARAMTELKQRGLDQAVLAAVNKGTPLLGICLGMQLLFEASEEFGIHAGLSVLPGRVMRIPDRTVAGTIHKVPHIAWSALEAPPSVDWSNTPLRKLQPGACAYFVHSYRALCAQPQHLIAHANYGGHPVTAMVGNGQVWGAQFHPEKSGTVGLSILQQFLAST